jgi:hypothetical protein
MVATGFSAIRRSRDVEAFPEPDTILMSSHDIAAPSKKPGKSRDRGPETD